MYRNCEGCGEAGDFRLNDAGFFICTSCGTVQQTFRDEYRDADDLYLANICKSQRVDVRRVTKGGAARRAAIRRGTDYSADGVRDLEEWAPGPPTEYDLMRATQMILQDLIKQLVEGFALSEVVEQEARAIWFRYLAYLVSTDCPLATYFADTDAGVLKIGARRLYRCPVESLSLDAIGPLSSPALLKALKVTGLDRCDYVARRAPFYRARLSRPRCVAVTDDADEDEEPIEPPQVKFEPVVEADGEGGLRTASVPPPVTQKSVEAMPPTHKRYRIAAAAAAAGIEKPPPWYVNRKEHVHLNLWERVVPSDSFSKKTEEANLAILPRAGAVPDTYLRVMTAERDLAPGPVRHENDRFCFGPPRETLKMDRLWMIDVIFEHDVIRNYVLCSPDALNDDQASNDDNDDAVVQEALEKFLQGDGELSPSLRSDFEHYRNLHLPMSFTPNANVAEDTLATFRQQLLRRPSFAHLRSPNAMLDRVTISVLEQLQAMADNATPPSQPALLEVPGARTAAAALCRATERFVSPPDSPKDDLDNGAEATDDVPTSQLLKDFFAAGRFSDPQPPRENSSPPNDEEVEEEEAEEGDEADEADEEELPAVRHLDPLLLDYSVRPGRVCNVAEAKFRELKQRNIEVPGMKEIVFPEKVSSAKPLSDQVLLLLHRSLSERGRQFGPFLRLFARNCAVTRKQLFRTILMREIFERLGGAALTRQRLSCTDDESLPDPPPLKHSFILGIVLAALLRTRHGVVAADLCRWVGCGKLIFIRANLLPRWLEQLMGISDSRIENFRTSEADLEFSNVISQDKSIFNIRRSIQPVEVELAVKYLIKINAVQELEPFNVSALVPRLLQFCRLPGEIAPLIHSFLQLLQKPRTIPHNGLKPIPPLTDSIYGNLGSFAAPFTAAVAVLIVARIVWPIFVYHPVGPPGAFISPGLISVTEETGATERPRTDADLLDKYGPRPLRDAPAVEDTLRYDFSQHAWIAIDGGTTEKWDCDEGLLTAGLRAVTWLHARDPAHLERIRAKMTHARSTLRAEEYSNRQTIPPTAAESPELETIFRFLGCKFPKAGPGRWQQLLMAVPSCQEVFTKLILECRSDAGFLQGGPAWMNLCENWGEASLCQKQSALRELSAWVIRSNLQEARHAEAAAELLKPTEALPGLAQLMREREFLEEDDDPGRAPTAPVLDQSLDQSLEASEIRVNWEDYTEISRDLLAAYITSVRQSMQEPAGPTCFAQAPTWKSRTRAKHDTPHRETRLPLPFLIVLRRAAAMLDASHLRLLEAVTDTERWLWGFEAAAQILALERRR